MSERPKLIQKLFSAGISAATKKKRGASLTLGEGLALARRRQIDLLQGPRPLRRTPALLGQWQRCAGARSGRIRRCPGHRGLRGLRHDRSQPRGERQLPGCDAHWHGRARRCPGCASRSIARPPATKKNGEIVVYGDNVMRGYHPPRRGTAARADAPTGACVPVTWATSTTIATCTSPVVSRAVQARERQVRGAVAARRGAEALAVHPEHHAVRLNRPHNVALVVIDEPAIAKWAREKGLEIKDNTSDQAVQELIRSELQGARAQLPQLRKAESIPTDPRRLHGRKWSADPILESTPESGPRSLLAEARGAVQGARAERLTSSGIACQIYPRRARALLRPAPIALALIALIESYPMSCPPYPTACHGPRCPSIVRAAARQPSSS